MRKERMVKWKDKFGIGNGENGQGKISFGRAADAAFCHFPDVDRALTFFCTQPVCVNASGTVFIFQYGKVFFCVFCQCLDKSSFSCAQEAGYDQYFHMITKIPNSQSTCSVFL